jgi:hypothetical protein
MPHNPGVPRVPGRPPTGPPRRTRRRGLRAAGTLALAVLALAGPAAAAELELPPGFAAEVYVTGEGYGRGAERDARGIPVATTLAFDRAGTLYLARSGNRYGFAQSEDSLLTRIYRVPVGGAQLTPETEARYQVGPPLRNPEVGAAGAPGEVFVTTFDPERKVGVLYRMRGDRPILFAGGTPAAGGSPLLVQPEGVAVDSRGHVYVADRARDLVVRLDPAGRVLEPRYRDLHVPRARMLAVDPTDHLWIAGDGAAERPWQEGPGPIWRVPPEGPATLVFDGPHASAVGVAPGGALFVAQRPLGRIVILLPDGRVVGFARFTGERVPRSLTVAPDTPETRAAGIAGDLFVVTMAMRSWYVNEVLRISGPFAAFLRREGGRP